MSVVEVFPQPQTRREVPVVIHSEDCAVGRAIGRTKSFKEKLLDIVRTEMSLAKVFEL